LWRHDMKKAPLLLQQINYLLKALNICRQSMTSLATRKSGAD